LDCFCPVYGLGSGLFGPDNLQKGANMKEKMLFASIWVILTVPWTALIWRQKLPLIHFLLFSCIECTSFFLFILTLWVIKHRPTEGDSS
jgi:hypothetical protein